MSRRPSSLVLACLAATVALVACGGGAGAASAPAGPTATTAPAAPPASTATPASTTGTGAGDPAASAQTGCPAAGSHDVEGGLLVVPPGARQGATPLLVVVISGGGGDATDGLGIVRAGRARRLAVLYPTSNDGFWTLNHAQGDQDVTDVRGLVERTLAGGCFDLRRISITGVSNGAGFATRMACEMPGTFAAAIPAILHILAMTAGAWAVGREFRDRTLGRVAIGRLADSFIYVPPTRSPEGSGRTAIACLPEITGR